MARSLVRMAAAFSLMLGAAFAVPAPAAPPALSPAVEEFLRPFASASKACLAALRMAEDLAQHGRWKSAYAAVDEFDKANADPYALAMKTSLAIRGAVRSDMFRAFGFVDLEEGQDLEALRQGEGIYPEQSLDPPALAEAQAAKGIPAPAILSKLLGDYYYEVLARYAGKWSLSDKEILEKTVELYAKAVSAGVFDASSLMKQAESLVHSGRGDEAEPVYAKAIALEPTNAPLRYSHAMSLAYAGRKAEALTEVDAALVAFGDSSERIYALELGARTAAQLGDGAKKESYLAMADQAYPGTPTAGMLRHMIAVESDDEPAALAAAEGLVRSYGSNPSVVRMLISTWYSAGKTATARRFLQGSIAEGGDELTLGTLNFYLAILLAQGKPSVGDKGLALEALDEAKAHFMATLGPDNDVYGVMEEIRGSLQEDSASEK